MDKPIEHDANKPQQRVTAVQGAEVLLGHRRAAQDLWQRRAAAQFAQRFERTGPEREHEGDEGAPARWAAASLGALFKDEALPPAREEALPPAREQALPTAHEEALPSARDEALPTARDQGGASHRDADQGGGHEDEPRTTDEAVGPGAELATLSDVSPAAGASSVHALEQAALSLQQTLAGPSVDQLAREIAHCVRHSAHMRASQWQMTLRLKQEILPETELEIEGNGYRLRVLLRTADVDAYRLVSESKEELDALLRKRGATDVQTHVAFEPLSTGA